MEALLIANNICFWLGVSGKAYEYRIYPLDHKFETEAGNFIFAKLNNFNEWKPVYIGQSNDMSKRLVTQETLDCVLRNGGTYIHIHPNPAGSEARLREEIDLQKQFSPPCNDR